jgi:hypothetical protein
LSKILKNTMISTEFQIKNCSSCGKKFQSFWVHGVQLRRCPTCADIKQHRPSVIIDRGVDFSAIVKVKSLPSEWQVFQSNKKDFACWKQSVKGEQFGASWDGRIDLYSQDTIPPKPTDIALLESCVAVHRREDMPDRPIEIRTYFRLNSAGMQPSNELPELIWLTAGWKTTIKGLGRQWRNELVGSPIWESRISGQVRTGRMGTIGSLAIVDESHPLEVKEVFDR